MGNPSTSSLRQAQDLRQGLRRVAHPTVKRLVILSDGFVGLEPGGHDVGEEEVHFVSAGDVEGVAEEGGDVEGVGGFFDSVEELGKTETFGRDNFEIVF